MRRCSSGAVVLSIRGKAVHRIWCSMSKMYCSIRLAAPCAFSSCSVTRWAWVSRQEKYRLTTPLETNTPETTRMISVAYLGKRRKRNVLTETDSLCKWGKLFAVFESKCFYYFPLNSPAGLCFDTTRPAFDRHCHIFVRWYVKAHRYSINSTAIASGNNELSIELLERALIILQPWS